MAVQGPFIFDFQLSSVLITSNMFSKPSHAGLLVVLWRVFICSKMFRARCYHFSNNIESVYHLAKAIKKS